MANKYVYLFVLTSVGSVRKQKLKQLSTAKIIYCTKELILKHVLFLSAIVLKS